VSEFGKWQRPVDERYKPVRVFCTVCQRMTLGAGPVTPVAAGMRSALADSEKTCSECDWALGTWLLGSPGVVVEKVWRLELGERPRHPTPEQLRQARENNPVPFEQAGLARWSKTLREEKGNALVPIDAVLLLQRGMNPEALFAAASYLVGYEHGAFGYEYGAGRTSTPVLAKGVLFDARLMRDGAVATLRQALRPA
jgi:hypothetical protein